MPTRASLVALLAAAAFLAAPAPPRPTATTPWASSSGSVPGCPTQDWGAPILWQPDRQCCTPTSCQLLSGGTTYKRTTRARAAECNGCPAVVGDDEGAALPVAGSLPDLTSSCVALDVAGGAINGDHTRAFIDETNAIADRIGKERPLWFRAIRADEVNLHRAAASVPGMATFDPLWVLRTDRAWTGGATSWTGWISAARAADATRQGLGCLGSGNPWPCCTGAGTGTCTAWSHCRGPSTGYDPLDVWDTGDTGGGGDCDAALNGWQLCTLLDSKEPGLCESAAYYVFARGGSSQQMFSPVGVLADLSSSSYRAWFLEYVKRTMDEEGEIGWYLTLKLSQYRNPNDSGNATNYWPNTGDGLGGANGTNCSAGVVGGSVDSLAELALCDAMFSGPPETAAGAAQDYPAYVAGISNLVRESSLYSPRLPVLLIANPNWFAGCTTLNADGTGSGCTDAFDWPATAGVNEAALLRRMVADAGYVWVELAGRLPTEALGVSGLTYANVLSLLANGAGAKPIKVWPVDTSKPLGTTPAICGGREINPEPLLTIEEPSPISPVITASPVQGATCVAPCVVHLDATATTATGYTNPFRDLDYTWDCGEPGAGTWASTGGDRNKPRGPITGCPYETAGTKTITLTVREPNGASFARTQTTVTVTAPATAFPGTQTVCVSSSGTFSDCPDGGTGTRVTTSDFDSALTGNANCNVDAGKRRCLFRCGETFTADASSTFFNDANPGLIDCYGGTGGAFNVNASSHIGTIDRGWTVAHMNLTGTVDATANLDVHNERGNITLFENTLVARSRYNVTTQFTGAAHPNLVAIAGSNHSIVNVADGTGYSQHFLRGTRYLLLGNVFDADFAGEFNLRATLFSLSAVQHTVMKDPQDDLANGGARNPFQLRGMASPSTTSLPVAATQYVVVSDNVTESQMRTFDPDSYLPGGISTASGAIWRVCQENGCAGSPGVDMVDIIFERNFSRGTGAMQSLEIGAFYLQGGRITVRNNVVDMQGATALQSTQPNQLVQHFANNASCPGCVQDEITVQGNTVYYDESTSKGLRLCNSGAGTGHVCQANLRRTPNDTTARTNTGTWSALGNVTAATNPFGSTPRDQGLTDGSDFELGVGSPALDQLSHVFAAPPMGRDFDSGCRLDGSTGAIDAGAQERTATNCDEP